MDKMRWRYGDTNPVVAAVNGDTVIEIGDAVFQNVNEALPASEFPLGPTEFKDYFLGVAMQRSRKGDTSNIRVATTGVFEFDCEPRNWELGDLVRMVGNQNVAGTDYAEHAIGRVAKFQHEFYSSPVLVDIRSTVMTGGV